MSRAPLAAALAGALLLAACASAPPVPDTALGLSKGSVFDVAVPPAVKADESAPGEQPLLPRPYALAPPRAPHGLDAFLPITPAQNACADCHAVKERTPGGPTPLPPSHRVDLRNAPGKVGEAVAGARWVCTACHVARTDARPLVGNGFGQR